MIAKKISCFVKMPPSKSLCHVAESTPSDTHFQSETSNSRAALDLFNNVAALRFSKDGDRAFLPVSVALSSNHVLHVAGVGGHYKVGGVDAHRSVARVGDKFARRYFPSCSDHRSFMSGKVFSFCPKPTVPIPSFAPLPYPAFGGVAVGGEVVVEAVAVF
jgi:hypothetical protein